MIGTITAIATIAAIVAIALIATITGEWFPYNRCDRHDR